MSMHAKPRPMKYRKTPLAMAICFLVIASVHAQTSLFTGIPPLAVDSAGSYRLLFGGHFHGASTNASGFPASSILANIEPINALGANALFSTGDLFLDPDANGARYHSSFLSKLEVALYNAPGNHDLEGTGYEQRYGPTFGILEFGADRVIWLDTERDNGSILNEQMVFLRDALSGLKGTKVFIVSHRPIWAEEDATYAPLFEGNTRSTLGTNFQREVYPLLQQAAARAQVFWLSGSMAGKAPASIFFQPHANNITYIQCAIRDLPRDALLLADVSNGTIRWQGISLTGQKLKPVEEYDARWWQRSMSKAPPFNPRLIPMHVANALGAIEFWAGLGVGVLLLLLLRFAFRRWL